MTKSASELIDGRIAELGDWRGETLGRMRALIREADPDVVEEWKWRGTPIWSHDGIICTGESYRSKVKLTFAKGASLQDPARLFNSSLDGNTRRARRCRPRREAPSTVAPVVPRRGGIRAAPAGYSEDAVLPGGGKTTRRAVAAFALAVVLALPGGAHAQGVDQTCELTATRFDPDTVNVLFPDSSAQYWSARYTAVPGTRIRIDGLFPYARYTSWNVYDPMLRPFAKKSDFELVPEPGSANPFLPGADRTTPPEQRHYTLFITFDPNDRPGPNTIHVDPAQNPRGVFTLRVYVPDQGRDSTGGVGLPQVTWEPTSSSGPPPTTSPCRTLQKPSSTTVTDAYAGTEGPDGGPPYPGRNPPVWRKFVNLCQSGDDLLFDNEAGDRMPDSGGESPCGNFGEGGFLSNLDNAYVYSFISRGFGPIVVFRGRAPTFAATYANAPVMPSGVQLRYWSFCQNDPFTQRYIGCRRDDQVRVDANGDYTIVVAQPGDWPKPAQKRCRTASWVPWGPQPQGAMIYRHMLPDPGFAEAIQNVSHGHEAEQMGAYHPSGRYFSDWHAVAKALC